MVRVYDVFRVAAGTSCHVRMLSARLGGLFTHWTKDGSVYCHPAACPDGLHRTRQYWRGYVDAEGYNPANKLWVPLCLEITEALEKDMRGQYARGQVWELSRERVVDKNKPPVRGRLHDVLDPATLRKEMDVRPVLCNLFHVPHIELDKINPLPDRIIVEATAGDAPRVFDEEAPADKIPPGYFRKIREDNEAKRRRPSPPRAEGA